MMDGPGKSDRPGKADRPTVPAKSLNTTGQPVAEGMEGRGLAKGNLLQQNASRTPSRNDAPSALERVRQAAKKDRKMRFTALLHHIYNLETFGGLADLKHSADSCRAPVQGYSVPVVIVVSFRLAKIFEFET